MNKKEVVKEFRRLLTKAVQDLPDDIEYSNAILTCDYTYQDECEYGRAENAKHGNLHVFELIAEEKRYDDT